MKHKYDHIPISSSIHYENVYYWEDIWLDLCNQFIDGNVGIKFITPHTLLLEIVDEFESNTLVNKKLIDYFRSTFEKFLNSHPVISKKYKSDFLLVSKSLTDKNFNYVVFVCKQILNRFSTEKYNNEIFNLLLDSLKVIPESRNFEDISNISRELIVELLIDGHTINEVREYVSNTFADYVLSNDGQLMTKFSNSSIRRVDYPSRSEFIVDVVNELDNMSMYDRIMSFTQYLSTVEETYLVLFKINGIVINDDEVIYCRNMKLYNSNNVSLIKQEKDYFGDLEFVHKGKDRSYSTLLIEVKAKTSESATQLAITDSELFIDILRLNNNNNQNLIYRMEDNIILRDNFQLVSKYHVSYKPGTEAYASTFPVFTHKRLVDDVINKYTETFAYLEKNNYHYFTVLQRSFSFFSKAEIFDKYTDKLLYYWITLETLFEVERKTIKSINNEGDKDSRNISSSESSQNNKVSMIFKVLPNMQVQYYKTQVLRDVYREIQYLYYLQDKKGCGDYFDYSDDVLEKLKIVGNDIIDSHEMIPLLDLLLPYTKNQLLKQKIEYAIKFYDNNDVLKEQLEKVKDGSLNELYLLYKLRNQIAHSAISSSRMLPYFTQIARNYCRIAFSSIKSSVLNEITDPLEIFNNEIYRTELLLKNIETKQSILNAFTF